MKELTFYLQILTEAGVRKGVCPEWPFKEVIFALSAGLAYHYNIFSGTNHPSTVTYMMSIITNKKTIRCRHNFEKLVRKLLTNRGIA